MNTNLVCPPTVPLGEIAEFIRGVTYKPDDVSSADDANAIACMRTKNIQVDLEDSDRVYIPRAPIAESKMLREGDILVSSANSWNLVGKCCWVPQLPYPATFGGFTSVLRANPVRVFPRYLYHWFATDRIQALARSFGRQTTNISNLNQARCLELEIPLPPLDEQRRIAAILDKADALRRKRKRALELLDGLTQSIFIEMFGFIDTASSSGYPTVSFNDLVEDQKIGLVRGAKELRRDGDGTPYLRMDAIGRDGNLYLENTLHAAISQREAEEYELRDGDFLFNTRNSRELVGKTAIFYGPRGFVYNNNVLRVRFKKEVAPEYIHAYFRTPLALREIDNRKAGTTSVFAIYQKSLNTLPVVLPPSGLQRDFAGRTRRIAEIRQIILAASASDDILFSSLQHRAFSGQL